MVFPPHGTETPVGRLHWTLLLIIVYASIIYSMTFVRLAHEVGPSPLPPIAWGLVVAVGLFICILLHELVHSLLAIAYGGKVRSITLTFFGGASQLRDFPRQGAREAWIAAVGPLTSVLLALAFWALARWVIQTSTPYLRVAVGVVGIINFFLAAFNLLPAFPLGGGRVLRSILAQRMNRLQATRYAATVGKAFAAVLDNGRDAGLAETSTAPQHRSSAAGRSAPAECRVAHGACPHIVTVAGGRLLLHRA